MPRVLRARTPRRRKSSDGIGVTQPGPNMHRHRAWHFGQQAGQGDLFQIGLPVPLYGARPPDQCCLIEQGHHFVRGRLRVAPAIRVHIGQCSHCAMASAGGGRLDTPRCDRNSCLEARVYTATSSALMRGGVMEDVYMRITTNPASKVNMTSQLHP